MRFMTGFFQVFPSIYFPVWADTFGSTDKQKTLWMTMLLLCSPIGVLIGYILCASVMSYSLDWRYAFYIQAVCFILPVSALILTPRKYFDLEAAIESRQQDTASERQDPDNIYGHQYFGFSSPVPDPQVLTDSII